MVPIPQFTLLKTVISNDVSTTPRHLLLQSSVYICYSCGAITEHFTDKSVNARDAIFSHAYLKTDFG